MISDGAPHFRSLDGRLTFASPIRRQAMMFVILSPVGAYYAGGFKAVRVLADTNHVRAWPGGTGDAKCGGNYAATIVPQMQAKEKDCDQVLWLFGDDHQVTEVGTSNFFGERGADYP